MFCVFPVYIILYPKVFQYIIGYIMIKILSDIKILTYIVVQKFGVSKLKTSVLFIIISLKNPESNFYNENK